MLAGKHILVGVTGGIAAYKTAMLVRALVKQNAEVRVVMTAMAQKFVAPLTFATLSNNAVYTDLFDPTNGAWHSHVALGEWADLMLIAPLTANTLGKMANGIADNLLLTTYLSMRGQVLVAPAMDLAMFAHSTIQENLKKIVAHGVRIIAPNEGFLASGLEGKGRMAEPEDIVNAVLSLFAEEGVLRGKKILVTSGPTREAIDPVRFISNHSSGKMGAAIAESFALLGAEVFCISGPGNDRPRSLANIHCIDVVSAQEMYVECTERWQEMDCAIMAAAVADYTPKEVASQKIPHKEQTLSLELTACPDIARTLGVQKRAKQILVGFALETGDGLENARRKLKSKNMDLCILNTLADKGAGFCTATNKTTFVYADGRTEARPLELKAEPAQAIAVHVAKMLTL